MSAAVDIPSQRAQAESRLSELRRLRGAQILDGKTADDPGDPEIDRLERLIVSLNDAEGVQAIRLREENAAEIAATTAALRKQLLELEAQRLDAVKRAERCCRDLVAALTDVLVTGADMRKTCLRGRLDIPIQLGEAPLVSRLSMLLAAVLATIPGHRRKFGALTCGATPRTATDDWCDHERTALAQALKQITNSEIEQ